MKNLMIIILAAGEGTRMRSETPKVLHPISGRPLLFYILDIAESLGSEGPKIAVLGRGHEEVGRLVAARGWDHVYQKERLGTGHAVLCAMDHIKKHQGDVLVLNGDTPLLRKATLKSLLGEHARTGAKMTILAARVNEPEGYGRIIRSRRGVVEAIREEKDLDETGRYIREINAGVYAFGSDFLSRCLPALKKNPSSGEYYLTDLARAAAEAGTPAEAFLLEDTEEALGVNSRGQLAEAGKIIRRRILDGLMDRGVTIVDPGSTYIEASVKIGKDTVILPGVVIEGRSRIGRACRIGPYARISGSSVGDGVVIRDFSVIEQTVVGKGQQVGPMGHPAPKKSRLGGPGAGGRDG